MLMSLHFGRHFWLDEEDLDLMSCPTFVDKNTGEVYKPASWKSPHTKYVRFDLRIISDRVKLHDPKFVGWAGGYLYLR